jgi:prepilin-type N-terminal cleavage/methylation domain-containing protein
MRRRTQNSDCRTSGRAGFTLIEMLVSMALILFIMVILSTAFAAGLESFRILKGIGDMQEKLRSAAVVLRRDLSAPHFPPTSTPPTFGSLAEQDLTAPGWTPPPSGFFRVWQGSPPSTTAGATYYFEGSDADGLPSYRAVDHMLHFSIFNSITTSPRREDFLSAIVLPGVPAAPATSIDHTGPPDFQLSGTYNTPWAEVAYYLRQAPSSPTANGTPLYALYRRQRAVITDADFAASVGAAPPLAFNAGAVLYHDRFWYDISCKQDATTGNLHFDVPEDITVPELRFGCSNVAGTGGTPVLGSTGYLYYPTISDQIDPSLAVHVGDDLLLTDVVSFEVRLMVSNSVATGPPVGTTSGSFINLYPFSPTNPGGDTSGTLPAVNNPLFNNTTGPMVFDTWSSSMTAPYGNYNTQWSFGPGTGTSYTLPLKTRVIGLQIILRVWDVRTQQTRQVTITQDANTAKYLNNP